MSASLANGTGTGAGIDRGDTGHIHDRERNSRAVPRNRNLLRQLHTGSNERGDVVFI